MRSRADLERFIVTDPFFQRTLEPYECPPAAPAIVRRMVQATACVGVGPMAAVAGTIAMAGVDAMAAPGRRTGWSTTAATSHCSTTRPSSSASMPASRRSKPGAGSAPARPHPGRLHVVGHRGAIHQPRESDAALIISEDVSLADAAATALGNRIIDKSSLETAFDFLKDIPEITGAIAIIGDRMATYGRLPRIVKADVDYEKITKG